MRLLRVLVADRNRSFAEALATRIGVEPEIVVVGTTASATGAEHLTRTEHPDVAVLGETAPAGSNLGLVRRLAAANAWPVLITFDDDAARVTSALLAGARGFLPKDAPTEDLVRAVRAAARGNVWVEPRMLGRVLSQLAEVASEVPAAARLEMLTERERDVLACLANGLDYSATARELFLSPSTVRSHVRSAITKLGAKSALEAVALVTGNSLDRRANDRIASAVTGPAGGRSHS